VEEVVIEQVVLVRAANPGEDLLGADMALVWKAW